MIDVPGAAFGLAVDDQNLLYAASNAPQLARFEIKQSIKTTDHIVLIDHIHSATPLGSPRA